MLRLFLYGVILAALAALAAWMADHPGHATFLWEGWRVDTSAALLLAGVAAAAILGGYFVLLLSEAAFLPRRFRASRRLRHQWKGLKAVTDCLVAIGASDLKAARRASDRVAALLPEEPVSLLLKAQLARAEGNGAETHSSLEAMLSHDSTRFLAARSLSDYHLQREEAEDALRYAQEARKADPKNGEALRLLVESFLRLNEPRRAMLAVHAARRRIPSPARRRMEALIHLAEMQRLAEEEEIKPALKEANRVARLIDALPEAAPLLARFYVKHDKPARARRVQQGFAGTEDYACRRCGQHETRWQVFCPRCRGLDTLATGIA